MAKRQYELETSSEPGSSMDTTYRRWCHTSAPHNVILIMTPLLSTSCISRFLISLLDALLCTVLISFTDLTIPITSAKYRIHKFSMLSNLIIASVWLTGNLQGLSYKVLSIFPPVPIGCWGIKYKSSTRIKTPWSVWPPSFFLFFFLRILPTIRIIAYQLCYLAGDFLTGRLVQS